MTLYSTDDNGLPVERRRPTLTSAQRKWRLGSGLVAGAIVLTVALTATPAPYVIEQPGPTFDTLGTVSFPVEDSDQREKVSLITIDGATTYPTTGKLNMLTVNVVGAPGALPSWGDIILAWFDRSKAVLPVDAVFPPDVTEDQRKQEGTALMVNSQQDAIAAALTEQGYDVVRGIEVAGFAEGSTATGILKVGDVIQSVNGLAPASVQALRDQLAEIGAGNTFTAQILRNDVPMDVVLTPYANESGDVVLGIGASVSYEFPFEVTIRLDDVGGPSAGMMFALGIIDKLTPGELNGGLNVSGTGTIDSSGNVGPIGGIRQKLFGALRIDSPFFLSPVDNCDEVVGHTPDGIAVFAVGTLDEALDVLDFVKTRPDSATALAEAAANGIRTCEVVIADAK